MDLKLLLDIVITFAKIDLLSFGGGYVAIPIVEKQIVEVNGWMTHAEFSDVIALDELTPGPIAINCATFVGTKMAGVIGAICATLGNILPSIIISLILVKLYYKYKGLSVLDGALGGLKCMVVALIASTTISIACTAFVLNGSVNIVNCVLFLPALYVLRKYKKDPIWIILGCGAIYLIFNLIIGTI